jgi:hypothetical protein
VVNRLVDLAHQVVRVEGVALSGGGGPGHHHVACLLVAVDQLEHQLDQRIVAQPGHELVQRIGWSGTALRIDCRPADSDRVLAEVPRPGRGIRAAAPSDDPILGPGQLDLVDPPPLDRGPRGMALDPHSVHVADVLQSMIEAPRVGGGLEVTLGEHQRWVGPDMLTSTRYSRAPSARPSEFQGA